MPTADYKPPTSAEELLNKVILIILTSFDAEGRTIHRAEHYAEIRKVSAEGLVAVWSDDNTHDCRIPRADLHLLQPAIRGATGDRLTGATGVQPDFIAVWEARPDPNSCSWSWRPGPLRDSSLACPESPVPGSRERG